MSFITNCVPFLSSLPGTLLVVLGFLGVVGVVARWYGSSAALLTGVGIVPWFAIAYLLLTNCG